MIKTQKRNLIGFAFGVFFLQCRNKISSPFYKAEKKNQQKVNLYHSNRDLYNCLSFSLSYLCPKKFK